MYRVYPTFGFNSNTYDSLEDAIEYGEECGSTYQIWDHVINKFVWTEKDTHQVNEADYQNNLDSCFNSLDRI